VPPTLLCDTGSLNARECILYRLCYTVVSDMCSANFPSPPSSKRASYAMASTLCMVLTQLTRLTGLGLPSVKPPYQAQMKCYIVQACEWVWYTTCKKIPERSFAIWWCTAMLLAIATATTIQMACCLQVLIKFQIVCKSCIEMILCRPFFTRNGNGNQNGNQNTAIGMAIEMAMKWWCRYSWLNQARPMPSHLISPK